jgi:hypothetical protein
VPWGDVFVTSAGAAGVDVLLGCGGLLDQQLDIILGPDPRSCDEQENRTFPDDIEPGEPPQGPTPPEVPLLPELPAPLLGAEVRHPLSHVARTLLPAAADGRPIAQEAGR